MHLYIVGTHHKHQFGRCNVYDPREQACDAFAAYLRQQCRLLRIDILAEEMSSDARQKWEIQQTVPELVAQELGICHADCEPNEKEQDKFGILNEGIIKIIGLMIEQSEETIQKNIRGEYDKRELMWIRKIEELARDALLFVCGSDHSKSFAEKALQRGWKTLILTEEWMPNEKLKVIS